MPARRTPIGNRRHKRYVTRVRDKDKNTHGTRMRRHLTDQVEKYLKSLNNKDNIAEQLKGRLADLLARKGFGVLERHIREVAGHYAGRLRSWIDMSAATAGRE